MPRAAGSGASVVASGPPNRYAVPYDHVTDLLPVRITQRELFVYAADLRCIARHELAPRGRGEKLDPQQLHPRPRHEGPSDLDQLRAAFRNLGDGGSDFIRLIGCTPPRHWAHHARRILLLRERYDTTDLDAALAHAALYGAFDTKSVERILLSRARPRTLAMHAVRIDIDGPSYRKHLAEVRGANRNRSPRSAKQ